MLRPVVFLAMCLAAAALCGAAAPQAAKKDGKAPARHEPRIVADLSTHTVAVKTDFAGTRLLLFGALVGGREAKSPDIIVVVRGPARSFVLHRKKKLGPIWINANERIFRSAPAYYALLSTRPLNEIASPQNRRSHGIGLMALQDHLLATGEGFVSLRETWQYASAFVRLMRKKGLYRIDEHGVSMSGPYLFRAQFDLPANVSLGVYEADVHLFSQGRLLGRFSAPLTIEKRGFERFVYEMAHRRPLLYGLVAAIIALTAGVGAAAVFRKAA